MNDILESASMEIFSKKPLALAAIIVSLFLISCNSSQSIQQVAAPQAAQTQIVLSPAAGQQATTQPAVVQQAVPQPAQSPVQQPVQPPAPPPSPFWTGDGGRGMSIAILAPQATGLAENQGYLPSLVQGEFVSNFSGFSAISVLDRVRLDSQYAELLSGYYADDTKEGMDLGRLTPSTHILGGTITRTATGYVLQVQITRSADKMTEASYSGTFTFAELDNLTGIRQASLELLEKMGVTSTERTRRELAGAAEANHVNAQTALAQGITAQRQGTVVQALSHFIQSSNYDPGLAEAASRLNIITANISSGNIGQDARNEIQWRRQWIERLQEAEAFYANYLKEPPPYYLVYSTSIERGEINFQRETISLSITVSSLPAEPAWFDTINQVVRTVETGLQATGRTDTWGLNWPTQSVATQGNSTYFFEV